MRKTLIAASLVTALCAACNAPDKPPTEDKPAPQSAAAAAQPSQLRQAIQQPIDKARAAGQQVQQAADNERAQIEAAGG